MTGLDNSSASLTDRLRRYLQQSRESLVASLDGVSEYDVRRPVMPSGTNLLGLVKHLAGLEFQHRSVALRRAVHRHHCSFRSLFSTT